MNKSNNLTKMKLNKENIITLICITYNFLYTMYFALTY